MTYPISPTYSTSSPREYHPAPLTQRQRIAAISLTLKDIDIEGHASLKHVIVNVLDTLDAVEDVFTQALEIYITACNDVDRLADDHHPDTGAALAVEGNALDEIMRLMDEAVNEGRH